MKERLLPGRSKEGEDRTGELGVIQSEDELSHGEQLSQISRFGGYVQILGWEKVESTNNIRIEIRFPNGEEDETFFDWPEDSFSDSEFGRFVHQLGYTADTADMINEQTELFPYDSDESELDLESNSSRSSVGIVDVFVGIIATFLSPILTLVTLLDFSHGGTYDLSWKEMGLAICVAFGMLLWGLVLGFSFWG